MVAGDVKVRLTTIRAFKCNVFDKVDDYVEVPHNQAQLGVNLSNGFTISAWINPRSSGENNRGRIIDKSNGVFGEQGYILYVDSSNNKLRFIINGSGLGDGASSLANSIIYNSIWYHILVTISSGQLANFYINGVLSGTGNQDLVQTIATITTTNAIRIGNRATATDRSFDGSINNVKIWNKILTSAEIALDYAGSPVLSGLIHHFKLGGDYADYGKVGVAATNSGSVPAIISDYVAVAVKDQRVASTDKWMICSHPSGQIMTTNIE